MLYDVIFIVIKFINEIGVGILSLDFEMKEFSDFELLDCILRLLLKFHEAEFQ